MPCRNTKGSTNTDCATSIVTHRPLTFLLHRRSKRRRKADVTPTRMDLTSPRLESGEQKRMDPVARAAATDVGCSPRPEPSRLKGMVVPPGASAPDGWGVGAGGGVFSCSNGELNWCQSSSVSLKFRGWLFFVHFFFSLYVGMKNNNLLGKFCIDTQSRFLVED